MKSAPLAYTRVSKRFMPILHMRTKISENFLLAKRVSLRWQIILASAVTILRFDFYPLLCSFQRALVT